MGMYYLVIISVTAVLAYFLFRDTMNKIQYVQFLRIYWITRNNGGKGVPFISPAFMHQTAAPWWRGRGIQVRIASYTFQFGVLLSRGSDLLDQVGGRDMEDDPKTIRKWGTS